ncbi:molybdenum cofactor guanylyltransferase [Clostridium thermobutyricum]
MIKCSAIILAGGKSSRMNYNPKGLLKFKDKKFIDREIEALKDFSEIIISSNDERINNEYKSFHIIKDIIKDIGPMGGFYSCLNEIKEEKSIIVSCDMPFLNRDILNKLGSINFEEDCLIPLVNGEIEPFCGVYKKKILEDIRKNIDDGNYSLRRFIKTLNVKFICIEDNNNFININTVEDYNNLLKEDK